MLVVADLLKGHVGLEYSLRVRCEAGFLMRGLDLSPVLLEVHQHPRGEEESTHEDGQRVETLLWFRYLGKGDGTIELGHGQDSKALRVMEN